MGYSKLHSSTIDGQPSLLAAGQWHFTKTPKTSKSIGHLIMKRYNCYFAAKKRQRYRRSAIDEPEVRYVPKKSLTNAKSHNLVDVRWTRNPDTQP